MFERLDLLPADPILGLGQQYAADANPNKVGLSVGIYQDEHGATPVLESVRRAEQLLLSKQDTKAYIPQAGDPLFLSGIGDLLFGPEARERASTPHGAGSGPPVAAARCASPPR